MSSDPVNQPLLVDFKLPEMDQHGKVKWSTPSGVNLKNRTHQTLAKVQDVLKKTELRLDEQDVTALREQLMTIRQKAVAHAKNELGSFLAFFFGGTAEKNVHKKFEEVFQQLDILDTFKGTNKTVVGSTPYTLHLDANDKNKFTVELPGRDKKPVQVPCEIKLNKDVKVVHFELNGKKYALNFDSGKFLEQFHKLVLINRFLGADSVLRLGKFTIDQDPKNQTEFRMHARHGAKEDQERAGPIHVTELPNSRGYQFTVPTINLQGKQQNNVFEIQDLNDHAKILEKLQDIFLNTTRYSDKIDDAFNQL